MRNKLWLVALALLALTAAVVATVAATLIRPEYERAYQHIEDAQALEGVREDGGFSSHLPLVLIETGGAIIEMDVKKPVMLHVIDNKGGDNRPEDPPALSTPTLINLRGKTSAMFDKPQYRLNFIRSMDSLIRKEHEVMGMGDEADWVLYGPYLDKTLLRNYLLYNLAGEMMAWAPHVRFCELFVDGEYEGLYVMIEAVSVDKHRLNISGNADSQGGVGYLVYRDVPGHTKTPITTFGEANLYTGFELGIEYPNPDNLTEQNKQYIIRNINDFEQKLLYMAEGRDTRQYAAEIDINSFVEYFIFNEFTMNRDAGYFSTYAYRDPRGKLTMGPVWDFNNAFDNHIDPTPYDQLLMIRTNWFFHLVYDSVFDEMVIYQYHQLRKTVLNEDRLLQMIDDIAAYLGPAVERNFARWDTILPKAVLIEEESSYTRNAYTYQEALDQLKAMIVRRGRFLDENLPAMLRERAIP